MIVAFVTALAVAQPAPATTGWPQDGYDSGHSNANTQDWRLRPRNVERLRLLWSRSIRTADEGWIYEHIDLPVVRDAAYAWWQGEGVETPRSVALSVDTGRIIWMRSQEWSVAASSADTVYANAGSWRVVALDAASGERRWARWGMHVFAAFRSVDRLVVLTHEGVGVIEASTGRDVWIRGGIAIDGHPVMSRGVIVVRADRDPDAILGLDAETGDTLWERLLRRRHLGWNSSFPEAAAGGLVYVVARWFPADHVSTIRALRLDDGSTMWRRVLRDDVPGVAAVGGGRLFVTRSRCATPHGCMGGDWERHRGALLALDAGTGRTIWMLHGVAGTPRPLWRAGALANGLVFASGVRRWASMLSRVVAMSAATGRIRWTSDVRRAFVFVSAVADGQVYVTTAGGTRGGRVVAYGLDQGPGGRHDEGERR